MRAERACRRRLRGWGLAWLLSIACPCIAAAQPSDEVGVARVDELRQALAQLNAHPQADAGAATMAQAQGALGRAQRHSAGGAPTAAFERERRLAAALVYLAGRQVDLAAARLRRATIERRLQRARSDAAAAQAAHAHARALLAKGDESTPSQSTSPTQPEAQPPMPSQPEAKPAVPAQPEAKPKPLPQPEAKPTAPSQPEAQPKLSADGEALP